MLKSDLRKSALQRRKSLSPLEVEQLNQGLLAQFALLDLPSTGAIHVFLPIQEKNEPNTFLLIHWIKQHLPNLKIILPKANFETREMTHHLYKGPDFLKKNSFNILEPVQTEVFLESIDVCLVPLLAFDEQGNRVGYGKGFYDQFLSQNPGIKKIGLSFFEAEAIIADAEPHDVRLDACITPQKVYFFGV